MGSAAGVNVDSSPRCGVVFPLVPSPITSPSAAEAARGGEQEGRLRRDEEVLDAPEELRQPVVGVEGAQEQAKRGSLCARRGSRKTVTCHGLRVVEPVYHEASLRGRWTMSEEERKKSRAGRGSLCEPRKTVVRTLRVSLRHDTLTSRHHCCCTSSAKRRTLQVLMHCSISCLVHHVSRKVFCFCMHVNTYLFLTLGLHTALLSSLTCDGLLFQDFIIT